MAYILFVGGVRSGKSRLARAWAEAAAPERILISVCSCKGIASPQPAQMPGWHALDEPLEPLVAARVHCERNPDFNGSFMLDSLGSWIANLMSQNLGPADILSRIARFADWIARPDCSCAVVCEECCPGFLPLDRITRKYADLLGDAGQLLAQKAHAVLLVSCGLPLALKGAVPAVLTRFDGQQFQE